MANKHTPGPWIAQSQEPTNSYCQIHAPNAKPYSGLVAMVYDYCDNAKNDADLIAAAPEMYETLERLRCGIEFRLRKDAARTFPQHPTAPDDWVRNSRELQLIDAALQKARGET